MPSSPPDAAHSGTRVPVGLDGDGQPGKVKRPLTDAERRACSPRRRVRPERKAPPERLRSGLSLTRALPCTRAG
jgi:hypothetical protein